MNTTAKPRTGPEPRKNRITAAMAMVLFESTMVAKRPVEARLNAGDDGPARLDFFADALVDQHVGIDRRADGEHDAGDARQGQRRFQHRHEAEDQAHMDDERDVRKEAEEAVGGEHEDDHEDGRHIGGHLARLDGVAAEAWADGALLHDGQLGRQGAGAEQHGKVVHLLDREAAGDLARSAGDGRLDRRSRDHPIVENDGELTTEVFRRRLTEALSAADVEAEIDNGLVGLRVESRLGIGQVAAFSDDPALDGNPLATLIFAGQHVDIGRALLSQQTELEIAGLAEKRLQLLRILETRNLHEHAVGALALDARFCGAGGIHATADDLDGLVDGAADALVDAGFRIGQRDHAVRSRIDVDGVAAGLAQHGIAGRLRQLAQARQQPVAIGCIRDANLHAALNRLNAVLGRTRVSRRMRRTSSRKG